jgi:hypothetical protein
MHAARIFGWTYIFARERSSNCSIAKLNLRLQISQNYMYFENLSQNYRFSVEFITKIHILFRVGLRVLQT